MILKCFDGPLDGAIYTLEKSGENTNRKPDGLWFNGQDEHGRWVQHQYKENGKIDMTDGEIVLSFLYDGPVVDTGIDFTTENASE